MRRPSCSHSAFQAWAGNAVPPCWEGARPGCSSVGQRGMEPEQVEVVSPNEPALLFLSQVGPKGPKPQASISKEPVPSLSLSQFTTQEDRKMG